MRTIVNDQTPTFVVPEIRRDVPLPKSSKGRKSKPLNPSFAKLNTGDSFVVVGEEAIKAVKADIARWVKAYPGSRFATRTLDDGSFGVWCMTNAGEGQEIA